MDMVQNTPNGKPGFAPGNPERMRALAAMAKENRVPKERAITLENADGGEVRLAEVGAHTRRNGVVDAFLYSTEKNKEGFFVALREIRYKSGNTKQTDYFARRKRSKVKEIAEEKLARAKAA